MTEILITLIVIAVIVGIIVYNRLERMKSSQLTPEVFETFLPFAFAVAGRPA